jgi:hypothetical protein
VSGPRRRPLLRAHLGSHSNIIFGLGSGLGGPVGGFANDKLGWRSAFMREPHWLPDL